jgi:hypothetical protein
VEGATLPVREIVTFIIRDEVDDRPFAQSGRLVKHNAPVLNARSQGAHIVNYTGFRDASQPRRVAWESSIAGIVLGD